MRTNSPKKTKSALLGIQGERAFSGMLPSSWGIARYDNDFGADFSCEVWSENENPELIERNVLIQVKARGAKFIKDTYDTRAIYEDHTSKTNHLPKIQYPKISISRETLEYLCKSYGFLSTLVFESDPDRWWFLHEFPKLFDPSSRILFNIFIERQSQRLKLGDGVMSITPLNEISWLLKHKDAIETKSVSIPLLPQSFNLLPYCSNNKKTNESLIKPNRNPYDLSHALEVDDLLFLESWKETVISGLDNAYFNRIYRIRFSPFFLKTSSDFLRDCHDGEEDLWILTEIYLAVYNSPRAKNNFDWLAQYCNTESAFLNYLILKCCRKHRVFNVQIFLACCDAQHWKGPKSFLNDPFDLHDGKYFPRGYSDELVRYFSDASKLAPKVAKVMLNEVLPGGKSVGGAGVSNFFGQITDGNNDKLDALIFVEAHLLHNYPERTCSVDRTLNVIQMLNDLGQCVSALEPDNSK